MAFPSRTSPDPPSPGPCDPAGRGRWHGTDKPRRLRGLLDDGIEVVDRFLVLAKLEVSRRPSEPSVEIIRVRLEGGFRRLQSRGGTLPRAGRRRCRSEIEVDQGARLLSDHAGEVRFRETVLEGSRVGASGGRLVPDAGVAHLVIRLPPGMQRQGDQPGVLELFLDLREFGGG